MWMTSGRRSRSRSSPINVASVAAPPSPETSRRRPSDSAQTLPITLPSHSNGSLYPSRGGGRGLAIYAARTKRRSPSSAHIASWPSFVVVRLARSIACQCASSARPSSQPERSAPAHLLAALSSTSSLSTLGTPERFTSACKAALPAASAVAPSRAAMRAAFFPTSELPAASPAVEFAATSASARSTSLSNGFATARGCSRQYSRNSLSSVCASTPSAANRLTSSF
mmetsp:Transcript_85642/g.242849  ORF Transcript_85642/g.242849 Transcript_85642/m.242849 type:complete len:226 (-) Transcript_85642:96-773(-)